ncbi:hypothetical protein RM572_13500 [Streptomyces sp. DSM 42041]|uniref:Uncharacterized protein n=1 Tax=Streptomyces hazeniae TaxID=3075538 RepID=A0ABU2NS14_9ACTN|nr:hypothetical protein [Streptomyces sp. DSM 42041]MDT0379775.1 hypothetical protein [Streptomyces sp. DSM 42041]
MKADLRRTLREHEGGTVTVHLQERLQPPDGARTGIPGGAPVAGHRANAYEV